MIAPHRRIAAAPTAGAIADLQGIAAPLRARPCPGGPASPRPKQRVETVPQDRHVDHVLLEGLVAAGVRAAERREHPESAALELAGARRETAEACHRASSASTAARLRCRRHDP